MKVLYVHDQDFSFPLDRAGENILSGGIPAYLFAISRQMREAGWDVAMVRFKGVGDPRQSPPCYELEPHSHRFSPATHRALQRIVEHERPDVVHLHSVYYALHPFMVRSLAESKPVLYTLHDVTPLCFRHTMLQRDGSLCRSAIGLSCLRRCYRLGVSAPYAKDVVKVLMNRLQLQQYRKLPLIAVPSSYLGELLELNGFAPGKIRVIPHFSRFAGEGGAPPQQRCRMLFVGRLVQEKGVCEFARALCALKDHRWEAVIVGEGDRAEEARALLGAAGVLERVRFTGNLASEQLAEQYRKCTFAVMPSLIPESFGLVGIEAMSFGKPVVAYRSGGITEWLEDGINGFLVPHGDSAALTEKIALLMEREELREEMGRNAAATVRMRFGAERHVDALLRCYRQLVSDFARRDTPPGSAGPCESSLLHR